MSWHALTRPGDQTRHILEGISGESFAATCSNSFAKGSLVLWWLALAMFSAQEGLRKIFASSKSTNSLQPAKKLRRQNPTAFSTAPFSLPARILQKWLAKP